jgi:TM2 domain-containing membrane protein YozV
MNCSYHVNNGAVVSCNGCGKPLCPACDHRIKGFPFCQDCIVSGVELLRNRGNSSYVPLVKRQTSPFIATVLSFICPGLGAAYNGQTSKALIYFAVFVALFQLAILTGGTALFVLGFLGMWLFAALDSWRTAQLIRAGITPNAAEDLIVKRISGNPKLWGMVLAGLGAMFFFQSFFNVRLLLKSILPVLLIGLGVYLLRDYFFKSKRKPQNWADFPNRTNTPGFVDASGETSFRTGEFETEYKTQLKNRK